jgi:hypothetical protein
MQVLQDLNDRSPGLPVRAFADRIGLGPTFDGKPTVLGPYDNLGALVVPTVRTLGYRKRGNDLVPIMLADTSKYHRRVDFIFDRLRENHRPNPSNPRAYMQDANDPASPTGRAWAEAWEWVIARGLVTALLGQNSDHWAISRRGRQVAAQEDPLVHLSSSARLDVDLHPRIARTVRSLFSQGLFDLAAFEPMKQIEIRVPELSKASAGDRGIRDRAARRPLAADA